MWNSGCPLHIPGSERSFTESVVVRVMLGEAQVWSYFVLFFLFVPGFYEEAYFVRFKGCNG